MTPPAQATRSDRPVQRRARETRERIEAAALAAFAELGFDGASTGAIARRAGVTQQLVIYHYETKLALWKAVADALFARLRERSEARLDGLEGVDDATRVRLIVRDFVLFSAEVPELARFMIHEGDRAGPRLEWLIERHIRPQFDLVMGVLRSAGEAGALAPGDPIHLFFLVLGSAAVLAQSAQAEMLAGYDLRAPEQLEAYSDLIVRSIMSASRPAEGTTR